MRLYNVVLCSFLQFEWAYDAAEHLIVWFQCSDSVVMQWILLYGISDWSVGQEGTSYHQQCPPYPITNRVTLPWILIQIFGLCLTTNTVPVFFYDNMSWWLRTLLHWLISWAGGDIQPSIAYTISYNNKRSLFPDFLENVTYVLLHGVTILWQYGDFWHCCSDALQQVTLEHKFVTAIGSRLMFYQDSMQWDSPSTWVWYQKKQLTLKCNILLWKFYVCAITRPAPTNYSSLANHLEVNAPDVHTHRTLTANWANEGNYGNYGNPLPGQARCYFWQYPHPQSPVATENCETF